MSAYNDGYSPVPHSSDCRASPVTELANYFTGLGRFQTGDTPRRCLNLSNTSMGSSDAAAAQESPHKDKHIPMTSPVPPRNSHMKKLQSFLPKFLCSSPKLRSNSKENVPPRQRPLPKLALLPDFESEVKEDKSYALGSPIHAPPLPECLSRLVVKRTRSPLAATVQPFKRHCSIAVSSKDLLQEDCKPWSCSPTYNSTGKAVMDGFLEILEQDSECSVSASMSCSMAQLLSEPLMNEDMDLSVSMCRQKGPPLLRSPSMPECQLRPVVKCNRSPMAAAIQPFKRHYSTAVISNEALQEECEPGPASQRRHLLKKTHSVSELLQPLGGDDANTELVGDFSKMYALPTVTGRHQELKYITGETMCALLEGKFSSLVESFVVVDCRYPYEFEGGHIQGAINLPNTVEAVGYLLAQRLRAHSPDKRLILVLHCEFSSERGPRTCRQLRMEDRSMNEYPSLHYPELYILQGGYRDFYHSHQEHCDPQSYCPMHHQDHREELLRCRTDSRASVTEHRRRQQIQRLAKH